MITHKSHLFKVICFTIGGVGSFAVAFYFYYFYFFMQEQYGFSGKDNLTLAALNGFVYVFASWQSGRYAHRHGYFSALKLGLSILILALAAGSQLAKLHSSVGLVLATIMLNIGQCFLWPAIEALVSEGEDAVDLPRAVGTFNVVWAATSALALFGGGTVVEKFGFGSIFFLPITLLATQLALIFWLGKNTNDVAHTAGNDPLSKPIADPHRPSLAKTKAFLRLAWFANPFAYIAINTFIPMLPTVAARFQLSPMFAGFACSLWCFSRLGTFIALWLWTDWHYRFRWLVMACGFLVVSFAVILIVPSLAALLIAQIFFGGAIGLIYYSSLFYSMDVGKAKGEHGGIHEAAIGVGNCIGPAVGAASLQFMPQHANSGAIAVSVLLLCGLVGLLTIWKTLRKDLNYNNSEV
ncbi:MAG: MFS transporter [Deltaproteobacteria bacterium]|nr:MFS transporter [Deltaproteobacteria bacterium]